MNKPRALNKTQREKRNTRFFIEQITKCESCDYFFNSTCQETGMKRYRNETACFKHKTYNA